MKKAKGPGTGSRYSGWRDCGPMESSYKYIQPVSHLTHRISWFGRFWTYGPLFTVHYEFDMIRPTLLPSRSPCADRSNEEKRDKGLDTLMKRKGGDHIRQSKSVPEKPQVPGKIHLLHTWVGTHFSRSPLSQQDLP